MWFLVSFAQLGPAVAPPHSRLASMARGECDGLQKIICSSQDGGEGVAVIEFLVYVLGYASAQDLAIWPFFLQR